MSIKEHSIKTIYGRLGDDVSRRIFQDCLMHSLTGDFGFVRNVIRTVPEESEVLERLAAAETKVIFGAGWWGRNVAQTYQDAGFACFVDNNRAGTEFVGLPVISFGEYLARYKDALVVISSRLYCGEIFEQLVGHGVSPERILNFGKLTDGIMRRAYFDLPQLDSARKEREVFVDAGVFDGASTIGFAKWAGKSFGAVYAFEPDIANAEKAEKNLGAMLMNGGGYSERGCGTSRRRCDSMRAAVRSPRSWNAERCKWIRRTKAR